MPVEVRTNDGRQRLFIISVFPCFYFIYTIIWKNVNKIVCLWQNVRWNVTVMHWIGRMGGGSGSEYFTDIYHLRNEIWE